MADPDRPLLADAKEHFARLAAELGEMIGLRWKLARLELEAALRLARGLAVVWLSVAILVPASLAVLVVWAGHLLPEPARVYWLFAFGPVLLVAAILAGWWAWRRFRRKFVGLEETLEELREDVVWLQEWLGRSEQDAPGPGDEDPGPDQAPVAPSPQSPAPK